MKNELTPHENMMNYLQYSVREYSGWRSSGVRPYRSLFVYKYTPREPGGAYLCRQIDTGMVTPEVGTRSGHATKGK